MYEVAIKQRPPETMVSVAHTGPYMEIGPAFDRLFTWLGARQLITPDMRSFGIFYDDPRVVPAAALRSRAAAVISRKVPVEAPIEYVDIGGGEYAVLRHRGPYSDLKAAYDWLYAEWLPRSGRAPGKGPNIEEYVNSPRDTAPTDLLCDICILLA